MTMGLLDVLNGMQNGPRGPSNPSAQSSGGMSPMTMAILALLAYKAVKHLGGSPSGASPAPAPSSGGGIAGGLGGSAGGGLGDILKGGLGGLLAGGAAGSVISGGLGDLLRQFQQSGQGETANSWVSPGPNKQISPGDLASALGARSDQRTDVAKRPVARGTAQRPQPASARGDQPFDAGRTAADRKRIIGANLISRVPAFRKGRQP
jgi:uncharacterized protein YidB (DUF937 family)